MRQSTTISAKTALFGAAVVISGCLLGMPAAPSYGADLGEPDRYGQDIDGRVHRWSGPYAGLLLGLSGAGSTIDRGAGYKDLELGGGSVGFGAVAGYNFASFGGGGSGFMMGLEADISSLGGSERKTDTVLGSAKFESSWLASARVRAGYAWERLYLYGTLGLALSDINAFDTASKKDRNVVRAGLAYGLGAELAVNDNWSARLEGIAYSFGGDKQTFSGSKRDVSLGAATLRLGITRRF